VLSRSILTFLAGTAFTGLKNAELYPSIGIKKPGEHLRANFGRSRFVFDIDGMMAEERKHIRNQITQADVTSLHPPDDENTLIQKLVSQYLAHEGYVETSKAFSADVRNRAEAFAATGSDIPSLGGEDDVQTMNRQKIRRAILDGDIDRALKYTHSFYPQVLQDKRNEDVYFQLRCRKFVELMRRYAELSGLTGNTENGNGNGNGHPAHEETFDNQMELDDQLHRESTKSNSTHHQQQQQKQPSSSEDVDVDMDTSTSSLPPNNNTNPTNTKPSSHPPPPTTTPTTTPTTHPPSPTATADEYLTAALLYGQDLQAEFGSDDTASRPEVKEQLRQVFAIMAYVDPRESVVARVLDRRGREGIAEGVNGAILVSLGKPASAAIEKLCAQTQGFLDAAAAKAGGKAGLVNVREDFLRAGVSE